MPVYDDQRLDTDHDPSLDPASRRAEIDELERMFAAPSAPERSVNPRSHSPQDLRDREEQPDEPEDTLGKGYNPDKKKSRKSRFKATTKQKWSLLAGGLLGGGFLGMMIVLTLLLGSLKLPHLMENITAYAFVRYTRQMGTSSSRVAGEALSTQATHGAVRASLDAKYASLRGKTIGRFDKFRPEIIKNNLGVTNGLTLHYKEHVTGYKPLTKITIDGVDYPMKQLTTIQRYTPVLRQAMQLKNQSDFYRQVSPALNKSLAGSGIGPVMRGATMQNIRKALGVGISGWALSKFKGKKGLDARAEQTRTVIAAADGTANKPSSASTGLIRDGEEELKKVQAEVIESDEELKKAIANNGGVPDQAVDALKKTATTTLSQRVLSGFNDVYAVGLPLCIIYDGSISQSGGTIDNNRSQQSATYITLNAQADQQKRGVKEGDSAAELANAIDGANGSLGDISKSHILLEADGKPSSTDDVMSAEAGAGGSYDYSLIDALNFYSNSSGQGALPGPVVSIIDSFVAGTCKVMTNIYVAAGIGVANVVAAIASGGGTKAIQAGIRGALQAGIKQTTKRIFARTVVKNGITQIDRHAVPRLTGFLVKGSKSVAKETAIVAGSYGLAEVIQAQVVNRAAVMNSAMAQENNLADAAYSGAIVTSNDAARTGSYGRALLVSEQVTSNVEDQKELARNEAQKPFLERYASIQNPNSLVSKFGYSMTNAVRRESFEKVQNMVSSVFNPTTTFSTIANNLSPTAHAVEAVDAHFNLLQFGWSEDEENYIDNRAKDYSMLENERILELSGKQQEIEDTYGICFTESIGTLLADGKIRRDSEGKLVDDGLCSPSNLSYKNDLVFRWRLYHRYNETLDRFEDMQNLTNSNASTAASADTSDPFADSTGVACYNDPSTPEDETIDLGNHDGYKEGTRVAVHLCAITSIKSTARESTPANEFYIDKADGLAVLNARLSEQAYKLGKDMSAAQGSTPVLDSGFRSMKHQERLCAGDPGCSARVPNYSKVAKPGTSNHQMGLALDFSEPSTYAAGATTCSGRATDPGSKVWTWLEANARKYGGLQQYTREAWHWDPLGGPTRCGGGSATGAAV